MNFSIPSSALWRASFDAFFGLLTKYCISKYDRIVQSLITQSLPNSEVARAVSREMPMELLRASLPHTDESRKKILLNFAQRAIPVTRSNNHDGSGGQKILNQWEVRWDVLTVRSSSAPNCKCFALEIKIISFDVSLPFVFTFMFAAAQTWHHGKHFTFRRILMPRVLVSVSVCRRSPSTFPFPFRPHVGTLILFPVYLLSYITAHLAKKLLNGF